MKQKTIYVLWGGAFILCAGLGFVEEPQGLTRWLLTGLSVLCFLPPALLLYRAAEDRDRNTLALARNLSALSLGLTLALLVLNLLSAQWPESVGELLYVLLVVVSSPMICSGYWALSLFLWACLLMGALSGLRRLRKDSEKSA